jgi:DNA-binding IclR family transcriptional regulator
MGRAYLATLSKDNLTRILADAKRERPDEYHAHIDAVRFNIANYPKRGFALNEGDAGLGVHGVGVYSKIVHLNRPLLFNCAVLGSQIKRGTLEKRIAPLLMEMTRAIERAVGLPV